MKNITLSALFLLIGLTAYSQTNPTEKPGANPKQKWKNPAESFLLSMFVPGTGQMYNDQTFLGIGVFGGEALLFGLGGMFVALPDYSNGSYGYAGSDSRFKIVGFTFIGMGAAIHLAQMIHAPIVSHHKNKVNSFVASKKKNDFNMAFVPTSNGLTMKLEF